jgi:hypothetical protein
MKAACLLITALLLAGCSLPAARNTALSPATPGPAAPDTPAAPAAEPTRPMPEPSLPVAASPTGQYVAAGLDGFTLYDGTGQAVLRQVTDRRVRSLDWSPDGRWLLVGTAGPGVLLVDPAARKATAITPRLTDLLPTYLHVAWAPDSSGVLIGTDFVGHDYSNQVWLLDPTTAKARPVAPGGRLTGLVWLPNNQALFLVAAGSGCAWSLRMDLATGRQIGDGFCTVGRFSPDGRWVAERPVMGGGFYLTDLAGKQSTVLWRNAPPGEPVPDGHWGYQANAVAWSPDSRFLAYVVNAWGHPAEPTRVPPPTLHILDTTGAEPERIARNYLPEAEWLPGAPGLLYATREEGGLAVHLGDRVLAIHPGATALGMELGPVGAALSRDGKRLVYTVSGGKDLNTVYVADLSGTGQVKQVHRSPDLVPVAWTENGAALIVARLVYRYDELGGGSATWGRYLAEIRLLNL